MRITRILGGAAVALAAGALLASAPLASAKLSPVYVLNGGGTTVTPDAGTFGALGGLGVGVSTSGPVGVANGTFTFPITPSVVFTNPVRGDIKHVGGLSLTAGETTVNLRNYVIDLDDGVLTAEARVNGDLLGRIPAFDITPTQAPAVQGRFLTVDDVELDLTQTAADALNGVFGVDVLTDATDIGVADVKARIFFRLF